VKDYININITISIFFLIFVRLEIFQKLGLFFNERKGIVEGFINISRALVFAKTSI